MDSITGALFTFILKVFMSQSKIVPSQDGLLLSVNDCSGFDWACFLCGANGSDSVLLRTPEEALLVKDMPLGLLDKQMILGWSGEKA